MDYVHKLIAFSLFFFSAALMADTYPVVDIYSYFGFSKAPQPTLASFCPQLSGGTRTYDGTGTPYPSAHCNYHDTSDNTNGSLLVGSSLTHTCPAGGTVSGSSCINAPACSAGQYRHATTHICTDPVFCLWPEVDNGTGACAEPPECSAGKRYKYDVHTCETPPTCGATETFNAYTWSCQLKEVNCPGHSHQNTAHDKCLPDPPLTCPTGQHDDGSYNCVANDAIACNANQVKGWIFGIPQCINKSNVDEASKNADDKKAEQTAAESSTAAAKAQKAAADADLAADPTNVAKQQAASTAAANYSAAQTAETAASKAASQAQADQDSATLKAIAQNTQEANDRENADRAAGFGTVPSPEGIPTNAATLSSIPNGSSFGTCPAPATINTSHGPVSLSYQPQCDFAEQISPIVLALAFLSAGLIVLGPIKDG